MAVSQMIELGILYMYTALIPSKQLHFILSTLLFSVSIINTNWVNTSMLRFFLITLLYLLIIKNCKKKIRNQKYITNYNITPSQHQVILKFLQI